MDTTPIFNPTEINWRKKHVLCNKQADESWKEERQDKERRQ